MESQADRLAALQAGLLDDAEVTALAAKSDPAVDVPAHVTARIIEALRAADSHTVSPSGHTGPSHAARPRVRMKFAAAICGVAAAVAAIGLGTATLLDSPDGSPSTPASAQLITVTPRIPLTPPELSALVSRNPDFGLLSDSRRRASCLSGLGYRGLTQVLGAQQDQINGQAVIILVLPGDDPRELVALAVTPQCSSIDTGLVAQTTVTRP